nr:hypothetical protein [Thermodesulfobacteriota bacterium]MCR5854052.1 hypothetical protein [Thermodesulfobacteriota bacterium]
MVIKIISVIRRCLKRNILLKNQEELYRKNLGERNKLKQVFSVFWHYLPYLPQKRISLVLVS